MVRLWIATAWRTCFFQTIALCADALHSLLVGMPVRTDIDTVAANITDVGAVADISADVTAVAGIKANVSTVASIAAQVFVTAGIDDEIVAVAGNATRINAVAANELNINAAAGNATNINAVVANATNINAVAANNTDISTVADNTADIDAVAASIVKVGIVADNIADVVEAADNMPAIIAAPAKADAAATSAGQSAQSAADAAAALSQALAVYANLAGGTNGQILMKSGSTDFVFVWQTPTGGGDVFKSVIDPTGKNNDAYNMANFDEGANALILRDAERAKIEASTSNTGTVTSVAVAVPTGFSVTGAITTSGTITITHATGYQGFTTVQSDKLAGIATGAQVNPNMALYQTVAQKGVANGYADLGSDGKIPTSRLPDAVLGALNYQTSWNAATNTPPIPAAIPANKGWYYIVSTAGTTSIDGIAEWDDGDWIVSDGTVWQKIDNTDAVSLVAGLKGVITAAALKAALALDLVSNTAPADMPVSTAQAAAIGQKANASVTFTGTGGLTGGGSAAANRTLDLSAASKASLALADSAVQPDDMNTALDGKLGKNDQAADSAKLEGYTAALLPVSTAQQTALNLKVNNSRITISTAAPSGGVSGDLWFKL